ncbi:winged helix DNA-binding domain-containing protein [Antrihabitans stalactiti]|uniref:Winged helix DNA-binding domain-containing protein n=1 Tax=Antrihabitans stalactiti TaxID=2584121 RepID=A0A848KET9_9NOCA|nr:winged helix DNA-binding domain-containing protein [Antrihabitans stalactiti]NMN96741.1 winged helix DNA-binding domain-containing protein [Antrihabitans stalactiti]
MTEVVAQRALGRALLERQHLLRPTTASAFDVIDHLVGMQAQAPLAAYVGLWTRIIDFDPEELSRLTDERRVARALMMRCTVHLMTAADCLAVRPLLDGLARRELQGHFKRQLDGIDVDTVAQAGAELIAAQPGTRVEIRDVLTRRWPTADADALAYAVSYLVPTVQITPRGIWGTNGPAAMTTMESWLGRPPEARPVDSIVLRYLAAYGPASVLDAQTWSGLTRLREVLERLRPGLRVFRSEDGAELFDIPDGPLPDPQTPAPVRFLPEYDNVFLSHADRTRVNPDRRRIPLPPGNGASMGTVLIDGCYHANWRLRREDGAAIVRVDPLRPFTSSERDEVDEEGLRLLGFIAADAEAAKVEIA